MLAENIRREIRSRLEAAFQERLQGVLLFGSAARSEERRESDLDLMVLLEEPIRLGKDLETIVDALYPVQLAIDALIHALPVSSRTFEAGEFGIYRNARLEGAFL
ncbi:MAG TPA: nucleotidyltransferase domain-containing protein [Thermoanaerobaculia bacterium]|nr:nucleotidyltransferase domain-containing protein [Thermoanaerobaculia bacterium]